MNIKHSLPVKIACIALFTLLLLIPLAMVKDQIHDRQYAAEGSQREVADSWGKDQVFAGPVLEFTYDIPVEEKGKLTWKSITQTVYPRNLNYDIDLSTQILHRSIYDIQVYSSDILATGDFVLPASLGKEALTGQAVRINLKDLRGIDGTVDLQLGEEHIQMRSLFEPITLTPTLMDGKTVLPFRLSLHARGSESMMVRPYGERTEVRMHADCPDPSFCGDFLPAEREITEEGFTARWAVSEINRGEPDDTAFGVNLLPGITQYQKTMRSAKYGILIILLVFVASLAVELVSRKRISPLQYLIIGLSLILFYALVMAFSEFMSFAMAYFLAVLMTVAALFGYFRGILRDRVAWVLTGFVALAYSLSYLLLQMENFAFLAGTLILFVLLVGVMYLTRNLNKETAAKPEF
ncbi:MAG: cell envelope integrity protein CreD [Bacteroidales bacterium]|nr:cell envelope integrity protein CreD [Bacteroidales bacterium]